MIPEPTGVAAIVVGPYLAQYGFEPDAPADGGYDIDPLAIPLWPEADVPAAQFRSLGVGTASGSLRAVIADDFGADYSCLRVRDAAGVAGYLGLAVPAAGATGALVDLPAAVFRATLSGNAPPFGWFNRAFHLPFQRVFGPWSYARWWYWTDMGRVVQLQLRTAYGPPAVWDLTYETVGGAWAWLQGESTRRDGPMDVTDWTWKHGAGAEGANAAVRYPWE